MVAVIGLRGDGEGEGGALGGGVGEVAWVGCGDAVDGLRGGLWC